jgi:hypothetical protein
LLQFEASFQLLLVLPLQILKSFLKYGDEAALKKRYFMHDLEYGKEDK